MIIKFICHILNYERKDGCLSYRKKHLDATKLLYSGTETRNACAFSHNVDFLVEWAPSGDEPRRVDLVGWWAPSGDRPRRVMGPVKWTSSSGPRRGIARKRRQMPRAAKTAEGDSVRDDVRDDERDSVRDNARDSSRRQGLDRLPLRLPLLPNVIPASA